MTGQTASCRCRQLSVSASGEPVRVSVCHCLDCKKRSGSSFAAQVRFPADQVSVVGQSIVYAHTGDGGNVTNFHFCPNCGLALFYRHVGAPETIAIAMGAFADPYAFKPTVSVFENRKHDWLEISGDGIDHD